MNQMVHVIFVFFVRVGYIMGAIIVVQVNTVAHHVYTYKFILWGFTNYLDVHVQPYV
jgi:hypothetical protein